MRSSPSPYIYACVIETERVREKEEGKQKQAQHAVPVLQHALQHEGPVETEFLQNNRKMYIEMIAALNIDDVTTEERIYARKQTSTCTRSQGVFDGSTKRYTYIYICT